MKNVFHILLLPLAACLYLAGCASSEVTSQEQMAAGPLPRPNTIWVYSFAGSPEDVPPESSLAGQLSSFGAPSPGQTAAGRQVGVEIASSLVADINAMGLNAAVASPGAQPQINDIVLHGYIISMNAGNEQERAIIGLGDGTSQLQVAVEGFEMTREGLRELGAGSTKATGAKSPGVGVGLAASLIMHNPLSIIVTSATQLDQAYTGKGGLSGRATQTAKEIAGELKTRFQQQGWIP
jgi:Domain of unknown function (DUF4410)